MRFVVNFAEALEIYWRQVFFLLVKASCSALKEGNKQREEEWKYSGEDFSDKNGIRTVKGFVVVDFEVDFTKEFDDFLFFESLEIVAHFELLRNRILKVIFFVFKWPALWLVFWHSNLTDLIDDLIENIIHLEEKWGFWAIVENLIFKRSKRKIFQAVFRIWHPSSPIKL